MDGHQSITDILQNDKKQNSYKIALIRAINDIVLKFPDLNYTKGVVIPLHVVAQFWLAYYWAFVDSRHPIWQAIHKNGDKPDMVFREALTKFRQAWQNQGGENSPSEGYYVKYAVTKKSDALVENYHDTLAVIQKGVKQPIIYAGTTNQKYFDTPHKLSDLTDIVAIPNTQKDDMCFVVPMWLWKTCLEKSDWVESMCVDAWCLFIQDKAYHLNQQLYTHADIYPLLTSYSDRKV
jgi:hypothetical protein